MVNAELTKINSDKCRTYKSPFGQMQNLQKSIRTNAELTKISKKFGQMHAPPVSICILIASTVLYLSIVLYSVY